MSVKCSKVRLVIFALLVSLLILFPSCIKEAGQEAGQEIGEGVEEGGEAVGEGIAEGGRAIGEGIGEVGEGIQYAADVLNTTTEIAAQTVEVLDRAIETLDKNSQEWQNVLKNMQDQLTDNVQSTIRVEIGDMLKTSIAAVGVEFRCESDFVGNRVKEQLVKIRAELLGREIPILEPVFCDPVPPSIEYQLVREGRLPDVKIYGYNYDNISPLAATLMNNDQRKNVTYALQSPSSYIVTINLGSNGVPLTPESDKIILKWGDREIRTISIIQPNPPEAEFYMDSISGEAPYTVEFTDNSKGYQITGWNWVFDDGKTDSTQNPIHIYSEPGEYKVKLTVSNPWGSDSVEHSVYANPPKPIANFEFDSSCGIAPCEVQFRDTSEGEPTSWVWDFGDGGADSIEQNPVHSYEKSGEYQVTLVIRNAYGESTKKSDTSITVNPSYLLDINDQYQVFAGGGGGGVDAGVICPPLIGVAVKIIGKAGDRIDSIGLICGILNEDGTITGELPSIPTTMGGSGGTVDINLECPSNMVLTGINGNSGTEIDQIGAICSTIDSGDVYKLPNKFGGSGGPKSFDTPCIAGYVITGLVGKAAARVDQIYVICTKVIRH